MADTPHSGGRLRFEAVVFDMDGVLVDSEPVHYESTVRLMEGEFGLLFSEEANAEFLGSTDRHMWEVLKERHDLPWAVDRLITRRKEIYLDLLAAGLPWRDGILELIAGLSGSGYRLAVASSALRRVIEYTLREGSLEERFEVVVSGEDVARPKPYPDIYIEAARQLGLPPDTCVAIEDTEFGVRAAKSAGMHVIAFPCMTTRSSDFSAADVRIDEASEIGRRLLGA
ncbi:MAG TPA: HAD-IA family hydrolase [Acidobacteriota bacterium]|nr:HAD-IA family hydrolase [Acidobacteriota bacterium]